ncbi:hypothetical protein B6I21_07095 [candidate division KSB1 bacterium 4572_119]|nr:MAG: hypothetical protein B6I21_07095 [candidate division KSB1 bacterium 4572_119]
MTTLIYVGIGLLSLMVVGLIIYLITRPKKKLDASLEYTTALNYLINDQKKEALDKLRDAVRNDTGNIDAYLKIGDILRDQGFHERAIKIHRGLTIRGSLDYRQKIDIYKSLIKDYQVAERHDKALKVADKLIEITRGELWAKNIKLKLFESAGEWDKAFDLLKSLQKIKGKKNKQRLALYKVEAGVKCIGEGRERDGRLKFREAIKIDKNCPPAYLNLGDSYIRENRNNDALIELKKFVTQTPEYGYLAFDRIKEILFNVGAFGEVGNMFRTLLSKYPDNEKIRFALVDIYERKGQLKKAIDLCYAGLEQNADSQLARRYLVRILTRRNEKNEALKYAMKLIDDLYHQIDDHFVCKVCGYESLEPKWHCPQCSEWNSFLD